MRSPAAWPNVSLISLNRSMSRYSSARLVLLRMRARDRLLQQVLELHAVRHFGQRVVAREITDAPLGAFALGDVAHHEDRALVLRIVGGDLRAGDGDRNGLAVARLHHGFARVLRGAQHVELAALAFVEDRHDAAADQLFFAPGEQLAGRLVGHADHAVGRGHEHRVGHAAEHVGQVVLVDRRLAQLLAHALERRLQLAELVAPPDFHAAASSRPARCGRRS